MALAYRNLHHLNHQLQFLLFEIGIGVSESAIENYIDLAHQECLQKLNFAAMREGLITKKIHSHHVDDYLNRLRSTLQKSNTAYSFARWKSLRCEIDETIANQALALAYREHWQYSLKQQAQPYSNFWTWLCEQHTPESLLEFLEQWGCIGHPYHPNFRTKIGFTRSEVLQYSPEFNAQVNLHWLAIHQDITHTSIKGKEYRALLSEHFPIEYLRWLQKLKFNRLPSEQYYPLPIHPWQWRHKKHTLYATLLDEKQLILMPHHQKTMPSMSFRTMMPSGNNAGHLKLSVGVQTTSSLRTISPASVDNGPGVSSWINQLLLKHEHYNECLRLAGDLAGINTSHPSIPQHEKKHLAMILRQNPIDLLKPDQYLVPLAALFAKTPIQQTFLFIEIIEASSIDPINYFIEYCSIVLQGQLHLLLHYGIALEAHQQNTMVVFKNNRAQGLIIRDLGGIKICQHPWYDHVQKPLLHPESTITCYDLQELINKFIHGNLQNNLSLWINLLCFYYDLSENLLWQKIHHLIKERLKALKPDVAPTLYQWHYQALLHQSWQQKNLLSMRLSQEQHVDSFTNTHNPLSIFA